MPSGRPGCTHRSTDSRIEIFVASASHCTLTPANRPVPEPTSGISSLPFPDLRPGTTDFCANSLFVPIASPPPSPSRCVIGMPSIALFTSCANPTASSPGAKLPGREVSTGKTVTRFTGSSLKRELVWVSILESSATTCNRYHRRHRHHPERKPTRHLAFRPIRPGPPSAGPSPEMTDRFFGHVLPRRGREQKTLAKLLLLRLSPLRKGSRSLFSSSPPPCSTHIAHLTAPGLRIPDAWHPVAGMYARRVFTLDRRPACKGWACPKICAFAVGRGPNIQHLAFYRLPGGVIL